MLIFEHWAAIRSLPFLWRQLRVLQLVAEVPSEKWAWRLINWAGHSWDHFESGMMVGYCSKIWNFESGVLMNLDQNCLFGWFVFLIYPDLESKWLKLPNLEKRKFDTPKMVNVKGFLVQTNQKTRFKRNMGEALGLCNMNKLRITLFILFNII